MKKSLAWKMLSIGLLLCGLGPIWVQQAVAQRDGPPAEVVYEIDWNERLKPNLGMQAHDHSLLGDAIDLQTGRLSFEQVDVSIPGNSDLPVEVRRRRNPSQSYGNEFADWQLVAPTISTKIMSTEILNGARWGKQRCSNPLERAIPDSQFAQEVFDEIPGILTPRMYSDGVLLDVPGRVSTQVLDKTVTGSWPDSAQKVTAAGWYLTCIANIDGKGTEGFHAYAPNGDRYRFDVMRWRKGVSGQERWKIEPTRWGNYDATGFDVEGTYYDVLAASEVVDVNGNWVRYDYDDQGRLTRIRANDGRRINFAYQSSTSIVVATATANPGSSDERRWAYSYDTESVYSFRPPSSANGRATYGYSNIGGYVKRNLALTTVMLPDGRQWQFNLGGLFAGAVSGDSYTPRGSSEVVTCKQADQVVSVTHPDGMTGEFKLAERTVYMPISASGGNGPPCPNASFGRRSSDAHTDMMSVVKKTLSGPGVPTATWKYSYETGGPERTTIIQPDGSKIYNLYPAISTTAPSAITSSALYANEFDTTPLQLTEYTYLLEPAAGKGFVPSKPEDSKPLRQREVTLTRGSDWYKTRYNYISDRNASNYSYGFPTKIEKWSSLGGGRRTADITYLKDENDWILGLTNTVTRNGKLFDDYDYDHAGRLVTHKRFGVTIAQLGYFTSGQASGRLSWHQDALGRKTTYSSWDRGVPVKIMYADNSSFERKVDRNGWVTREINGRGYITHYEYDDAGRLTKIDLPDDRNDWVDTNIDYTYSDGLLLQTATESSFKKTTTTYDAMLRPVRVEREDIRTPLNESAPGDFVETTYDAMGRVIFTSLPTYVTASTAYGTETHYDALGRVKQSAPTGWGGGPTDYEYLYGNKTRVTDPVGNVTITTRSGYGSPDDGEIILVENPEDIATQYKYDIYGNLTTVLQQEGSVFGVTQNYYYDARLRLCRHHSKERQSTLYSYNNANEMAAYIDGQPGGSSCGMPSEGRTLLTYDTLGRLKKTDYPNTSLDIVRTYDANGNLSSIRNGDVRWDYKYNSIDLIEKETLAIDGRNYEITHYYYKNGAPSTWFLPSGRYIVPAIDGYGRVTGVNTANCPTWYCIDDIDYHPNGMIKNLSFDDGKLYSQNQDILQRLSYIAGNWGDDWYFVRDKNGRITEIGSLDIDAYDRTFDYDGAGRLISATGPWGQARYEYDQLSNLTRKTLGSRVVDINYNSSNRVSRVRDSAVSSAWRNYTHDARGNVSGDGRFSFGHNHANRMVSLSGRNSSGTNISASYTYDGNLKRVKQVMGGETIYSIYDKSGSLVMRDNVTKGEVTEYVQVSGKTFLKFKNNVPYYIWNDHLGTPIMEARAGSPVEETAVYNYTPFGENIASPFNNAVNDPANHNGQGYTGHIEDSSGLVYMQARYYDPVIGRFLETDPVGYQDQLNLYAYVHNDPMNFVDPTGEYAELAVEAVSLSMGMISLGNNLSAGNYGAAFIDVLGVVADAALAAVPIAPGVVSMGVQGSRQGSNLVQGFHGTKMNNVNSIKADGAMNPNAQGEIYLSGNQADTFVHGADSSIGGAVSAQVTVDVSKATSVEKISVPGNPNTTLIKTDVPLPTSVDSVTVRKPDGEGGFTYEKM